MNIVERPTLTARQQKLRRSQEVPIADIIFS